MSVCNLLFAIPLHAARRAMGAAEPLLKQWQWLFYMSVFLRPQPNITGHSRVSISPSPHFPATGLQGNFFVEGLYRRAGGEGGLLWESSYYPGIEKVEARKRKLAG